MDVKKILSAISFLKSEDQTAVSALIADAKLNPDLMKALDGSTRSEEVKDHVYDHWNMGKTNAAPTREEIKTGPAQEASGGGAEKMIAEYSNVTRQMHGVAQVPEKLDAMMHAFGKSFAALDGTLSRLADGNAKIASLLVLSLKKGEGEEDEEDEEEESEVVEINASRGKSFLRKAKKLIAEIAALKSKMDDADDEGEKKNCKSQIKALTKKAERVLGKALTCAYAASSVELKKSIRTLATKSDINVVQEEEEEEEDDEEEEGKARKALEAAAAAKAAEEAAAAKAAADAAVAAAEKAKTDDKGNQADHVDTSNGNQAAQAKAIADALAGYKALETTVQGMMAVLSGKSKLSDVAAVPVVKAGATTSVSKINEAIAAAEEGGTLNDLEIYAAREIATKFELVKSGGMDVSIVNDRLSKASSAVKNLFRGVLAA